MGMKLDFSDQYQDYLEILKIELKRLVVPTEKTVGSDFSDIVFESMKYSLMNGGKRVRPILCLAFCELCGKNIKEALPFACAVEMIHTYSLIHDDMPCLDGDTTRRGKPANHVAFGEDVALIAGDGLLTKAFEVAAHAESDIVTPEQTLKCIQILASLAGPDGMVGGQCIDIKAEGKEVLLDVIREMDMKKTVALFSAACQMGVIAAGADVASQKLAQKYAKGVGLAFQIRDDILGAVGDTEKLGKSVGLDAISEKQNFVSNIGVEKAQELVDKHTSDALDALKQFSGDTTFLQMVTKMLVLREA